MLRVEVVGKFLCMMNFVNSHMDHKSQFIKASSTATVAATRVVVVAVVIIEFGAISDVVEDSILVY